MIEPRLRCGHCSRLWGEGAFEPLLDGFSEFQQSRGTQPHLLSTHHRRPHGSPAVRPLERQPNEPTAGMLDINVLLPAPAADGAHHH